MSSMLMAALIGAFALFVLLVFAVRNINRRNTEFQLELDAPKGHVSAAFLEVALGQMERHLQNARAESNVTFEIIDKGILKVIRTRNKNGSSGYLLHWEDRTAELSVVESITGAADEEGLPKAGSSKNKLEITFPDDYLRLEAFIERTIGQLDHDDIRTILTWSCRGLGTQEDTAK